MKNFSSHLLFFNLLKSKNYTIEIILINIFQHKKTYQKNHVDKFFTFSRARLRNFRNNSIWHFYFLFLEASWHLYLGCAIYYYSLHTPISFLSVWSQLHFIHVHDLFSIMAHLLTQIITMSMSINRNFADLNFYGTLWNNSSKGVVALIPVILLQLIHIFINL